MERIRRNVQDERTAKILRWRESLTLLPDERFFETMRTYLGTIQTPYNKQNLIERLSSIFRKEENKRRIISYLSEFDLRMLSVISMISGANQEKLADFFSKEFTISEVYAELLSLNERLLIYSYREAETSAHVIAINPHLEEELSVFLGVERIVPKIPCVQRNFEPYFCVSPLFLASYISFMQANPEICKNDLTIKKKDLERLESIFHGRRDVLVLLLNAFINLGIVKFGEKSLFVSEERVRKFAKLPELWQYVYIATAGSVRLGREGLRTQAQLFLNLAKSVPETGLTLSSLSKIAFLLENRRDSSEPSARMSGFAKILEARRIVDFSDADEDEFRPGRENMRSRHETYSGRIIDGVIENAVLLGLFSPYGKTADGETLYVRSEIFTGENSVNGSKKGLLNINAGTNVTFMPGLTLMELAPFSNFMNIVKSSTVSEFEISRKSVSRAFDIGMVPDHIFELLSMYTAYDVPQNLKTNVEEWYKSYTSAMLYKGYVLKLDEKTSRIVEKNPRVAPYIQMKLGDGIYLLNLPLDRDISSFTETCGLEFMGKVKIPENKVESLDFPQLQDAYALNLVGDSDLHREALQSDEGFYAPNDFEKLEREGKEAKAELLRVLRSLGLSKRLEEALALRIERGVILFKEQMSGENVRLEILEADGMNYAGKVRLVETAISAGDMLELTMPADRNGTVMNTFVGKPISVTKSSDDSILKLRIETDGEERSFSIGTANSIKLIKTSVFGQYGG